MDFTLSQYLPYFSFFSSIVFVFCLGFYIITCFQWFSYKINRVIFHFTKPIWHVFFFIIPIVLYYLVSVYFWIYFYFAYIPCLFLWHKRLDKKLVFTGRVKRFFVFLGLAFCFYSVIFYFYKNSIGYSIVFPIVFSVILSDIFEKIVAFKFYKAAKDNLNKNKKLKIILITASYGKTSMKNYLFDILSTKFKVYKTPRSVNTLLGIIKDINESLPDDTQIYIAEAGAREPGDILQITKLLNPHVVVVGEIGGAHLEYFKNLQITRQTKLEAMQSNRLEYAIMHSSTLKEPNDNLIIYDNAVSDIKSSLDGIEFKINSDIFISPILGSFNALNLSACICAARYFGLNNDEIKTALLELKNVEHRLNRIDASGKIIIDDGFNGNLSGMSQSYELVSTYNGRKVLVTPGIVEGGKDDNKKLAETANEIFDLVLITGSLNAEILLKGLKKPKVIIVKNKIELTNILAKETKLGDLILFSNDAPNFI